MIENASNRSNHPSAVAAHHVRQQLASSQPAMRNATSRTEATGNLSSTPLTTFEPVSVREYVESRTRQTCANINFDDKERVGTGWNSRVKIKYTAVEV